MYCGRESNAVSPQSNARDLMLSLSLSQLQFLRHHKVSLSRVFNADGMATSDYRQAMDELQMVVAFGVTPCRKAAHTLRTRGGHCVQCRPASLAFVMRHDNPAQVYVAYSRQIQL